MARRSKKGTSWSTWTRHCWKTKSIRRRSRSARHNRPSSWRRRITRSRRSGWRSIWKAASRRSFRPRTGKSPSRKRIAQRQEFVGLLGTHVPAGIYQLAGTGEPAVRRAATAIGTRNGQDNQGSAGEIHQGQEDGGIDQRRRNGTGRPGIGTGDLRAGTGQAEASGNAVGQLHDLRPGGRHGRLLQGIPPPWAGRRRND